MMTDYIRELPSLNPTKNKLHGIHCINNFRYMDIKDFQLYLLSLTKLNLTPSVKDFIFELEEKVGRLSE